jgi:hypothetical protein
MGAVAVLALPVEVARCRLRLGMGIRWMCARVPSA